MLVKRKIIIFVSCFTFLVMLGFLLKQNIMLRNSINEKDNRSEVVKQEGTLSMMVEQTVGAGDYIMETRTSWPKEGFKFNATLSKCENGSTLAWDDTNKVVTMTGNVSDKCYVYFDKLELITFTVYGVTYYADEGMTWKAFINSSYSDDKFSISSDYVFYNDSRVVGNCWVISSSDTISNISYGKGDGCGGIVI